MENKKAYLNVPTTAGTIEAFDAAWRSVPALKSRADAVRVLLEFAAQNPSILGATDDRKGS